MARFLDWPQEEHPERLFALRWLYHGGGSAPKPWLDLGCGAHKTSEYVIGVDVRFGVDVQARAEQLPFRSRSCGRIVARHVLEHLLDPVAALQEWARVLRPGGRALLILPDHAHINTMDPLYSGPRFEHLHAYTMESLIRLVELTGDWMVVDAEPVVQAWSFVIELVRIAAARERSNRPSGQVQRTPAAT